MARLFFLAGALMAGLAVAMGAYGTHADMFDEVQSLWVEKGSRYQMYHALALILTSLALTNKRGYQTQLVLAGWCFLGGIILFCGSLYVMTFLPLDIGYITPIGGLLFLAGWILMTLAGAGESKGRK